MNPFNYKPYGWREPETRPTDESEIKSKKVEMRAIRERVGKILAFKRRMKEASRNLSDWAKRLIEYNGRK